MDDENRYLNRADLNVERLIREKKWAKIVIIFACIGIFAGLSASSVFYFHYKLRLTPLLALISSLIASIVVYIHMQFLKDVWQIWTYKLKYWCVVGFVLQTVFALGFFVCFGLGIYYNNGLEPSSFYVTSVWSFISWKWAFTLFYRTKKYRAMFTRYSLIGVESEVNSE